MRPFPRGLDEKTTLCGATKCPRELSGQAKRDVGRDCRISCSLLFPVAPDDVQPSRDDVVADVIRCRAIWSYDDTPARLHGLAVIDRQAPLPPPGISVDVFIPTYNEPVDMVRRTVIGARDMSYPHSTWLPDGGHDLALDRLSKVATVTAKCLAGLPHIFGL